MRPPLKPPLSEVEIMRPQKHDRKGRLPPVGSKQFLEFQIREKFNKNNND
jgi:hypothetical protein